MTKSTQSDWLLAPMELSALVVGVDAGGAKHVWSDLSPDFSQIQKNFAVTGPQLVNIFPQGGNAKAKAPDAGIHLHWLLPQAFGHGQQTDEGGLEYPHVPNRWLVRRVRYKPNTSEIVGTAGWVIESDFLHDIQNDKTAPGAVNFLHEKSPVLFASVGKATPLQGWTETKPDYQLTLTALGSGTPDFPASYPACKSVLGFHDPQPSAGQENDWDVSYQVVGWCSDPAKDLLSDVTPEELPDRLEKLEFELSETGAKLGPMGRVLCHGAATRVQWNKNNLHVSPVPESPATVYAGNSSAEALATMLAPQMNVKDVDPTVLEPILTAFHYGMLGSDQNLQDVDAELHSKRFTSVAGGDRYSIDALRDPVPPAPTGNNMPTTMEPAQTVQVLPEDIAASLKELNSEAQGHALTRRNLARMRQSLFTVWCQWATAFNRTGKEPTDLTGEVGRGRELVAAAAKAEKRSNQTVEKLRDALKTTLSTRLPNLELSHSTAPPFFQAADPALLISGDGFEPANVYNKYSHPDKLLCRHQGEMIKGVSAVIPNGTVRGEVTTSQLFPLTEMTPSPKTAAGPTPDLLDSLLRETLLLDPVDPRIPDAKPLMAPDVAKFIADLSAAIPSEASIAALTKSIGDLLLGKQAAPVDDAHSNTGDENNPKFIAPSIEPPTDPPSLAIAQRPAAVGLTRWLGNPWRPMYLSWKVTWHPEKSLGGSGDISKDWKTWKLNAGGNDFALPDNFTTDTSYEYESYTMLAPNAAWVLRRRLEKLVDEKANMRVSEIISAIDDLPVVAQSLGGFQEALGQLQQGLQLPPISPEYVNNLKGPKPDVVADSIDGFAALDAQHMRAPDLKSDGTPKSGFQPIRAGLVEITHLAVVDSFGQARTLVSPADKSIDLVTSFGLPEIKKRSASNKIVLPPRYLQPARTDFQWVSAVDDKPSGSPLCGWIFPNHLDQSLMVCDAKGKLLGAVQKKIRAASGSDGSTPISPVQAFFWVPVPVSNTTPESIEDPELKRFVSEVLLKFDGDSGAQFLQSIETAQSDVGATVEHDPRLSILVGKPLALAKAELRIELDGTPYRDATTILPPINGGTDKADRGVTQIQFPLRLGGEADAAGGLAGFLLNDDNVYYPRFGLSGGDFHGTLEHDKELKVNAEAPISVTLLMDPHAAIHARTGVLPRHSLNLPEEVVAQLSSIRDVFVQSAPLVGPPGGPRVPKPSDDYGQWSWAVRPEVTQWLEYPEVTDPGDRAGFGTEPLQIQEGWLKLVMNPVAVSAFWLKEGSVSTKAGTNVTLGWIQEGAETLVLTVADEDTPLATFKIEGETPLPTEHKYEVTKTTKMTLTASDSRGNQSVKSLEFNVE